jgi:hypothetical protein
MGAQTADEFMETSGLAGITRVMFNMPRVKVFFPVYGLYFAVRKVQIRERYATVRAVLRAVELVARHALAYHVVHDLGAPQATVADVQAHLHNTVMCRMLCKRAGGANHVYVR